MDRDAFLARVGRAAMTAVLPGPPLVRSELPDVHHGDPVATFRQRAQSASAVVHGPMSRHGVPRAVAGIAYGHGGSTFMVWDELPVTGIPSALTSVGLHRVDHDVPVGSRVEHQLVYSGLDVGVTGAEVGLVESGSVVLLHGQGKPRMASLVPEIHIAILETTKLAPTLAHWAHRNPHLVAESANLVIVTGPSRTGDIEQTINLGVHGPRHLHVVLVD